MNKQTLRLCNTLANRISIKEYEINPSNKKLQVQENQYIKTHYVNTSMKQDPSCDGQYISWLLQKRKAHKVNYSEPDESSPHPHTILSKRHFNVVFQSSPRLTKWFTSFKDFTFKYYKHCYLSHARCDILKNIIVSSFIKRSVKSIQHFPLILLNSLKITYTYFT
jgi:hypothetical protein